MAAPPDSELNHEAIPAQQPLAASPGPDLGQRRPRDASTAWGVALIVLMFVSLGFAALQLFH